MDELDRLLVNRLQHGLPLVRHPWEALAVELGSTAEVLRLRVQALLDDGTLTRFGPMFDIDRLGGAFTLAALSRSWSKKAFHSAETEPGSLAHFS